jgi:hypothetical protein
MAYAFRFHTPSHWDAFVFVGAGGHVIQKLID